ncbi:MULTISPECIES: type II toxin-antitoxin system VapC family toxin [unclassified Crossiella]|uniref:type II toxin-antitoxin system VapC family toxin n=1 Tax=unclassified Crossiella TaxID=2620835 RepID=UPI001FFF29A6|nr:MULTISPECIES: type II toxin-antitoxin system VapC family toxin [unclassified Crossiella]MCK2242419.1 type II toxin-antitoxin system VapC family toxin [Crossiella sp. S99.2]MCK2254550.1 type II toxin-antitoxin system VapC family toxin [Crossiella sp. S99.1]
MIYLDSSAVVKLVLAEPESKHLHGWLAARARQRLFCSVLTEIEVPRAVRRYQPRGLAAVTGVLASLNRVEIHPDVRTTAAAYLESDLRSWDAIHLALAVSLISGGEKLTAFITYDKWLAKAAAASGLPVVAPGTDLG